MLPLYIGIEIVLGITILNKCSGIFGILALFTGHPLDLMQWISYLWCVITLVIYSQGLYQIHKPQLYTFSQIFVTFTFDSIISFIFTLWFTSSWFHTSNNNNAAADDVSIVNSLLLLNKRGKSQSSQGASAQYEYVVTMLITMVSILFRLYYNCLLASFVQELLRNPKFLVDQDDVAQDLKNKNILIRVWIKSQRISYHWCRRFLM